MTQCDAKNSQFNTIERCPHDKQNPYVMLNRDLIREENLSIECIWLLTYLLSMVDDWKISVKQVINHVKGRMGRDKVYKLFDEACEAGYMKRIEFLIPRKKGGTRKAFKYLVSEFKKFKVNTENQETGKSEFLIPENQEAGNQYNKKEQCLRKNKQAKKDGLPACPPELLEFNLNSKLGLCRDFLAEQLCRHSADAVMHAMKLLLRKQAIAEKKGNPILNLEGYFLKLLCDPRAVHAKAIEKNKSTAKTFKEINPWLKLRITEKNCTFTETGACYDFLTEPREFHRLMENEIKILSKLT